MHSSGPPVQDQPAHGPHRLNGLQAFVDKEGRTRQGVYSQGHIYCFASTEDCCPLGGNKSSGMKDAMWFFSGSWEIFNKLLSYPPPDSSAAPPQRTLGFPSAALRLSYHPFSPPFPKLPADPAPLTLPLSPLKSCSCSCMWLPRETLDIPFIHKGSSWYPYLCLRVFMLSHSSCIQLFETLWTGSSVHGILQARILEVRCSPVSDSLWPHGLWPTRLIHPWGFPGKNKGVGCQWVAISSSGGSSQPRDWTWIMSPALVGRFFYH